MKSIKDIPWECGKGWWPMIEKVVAAIDSFNAAHPDSPVEVTQIKQKFGGLRIYYHNAPEDIRLHRWGHRGLLAYLRTLRCHRRSHHQPGRLQANPLPGMPKGNQSQGNSKTNNCNPKKTK